MIPEMNKDENLNNPGSLWTPCNFCFYTRLENLLQDTLRVYKAGLKGAKYKKKKCSNECTDQRAREVAIWFGTNQINHTKDVQVI